jgi:hypothetical protein
MPCPLKIIATFLGGLRGVIGLSANDGKPSTNRLTHFLSTTNSHT